MENSMLHRESLHETNSHGKKTFPYVVYHARIPEWLLGFPLHWHDEFEIIFVTEGSAVFTVDGRRMCAGKNDMVLVPSGAVHSIERDGDRWCEYFNILFSFSLLEENPDSHCARKYFSFFQDTVFFRELFLKSTMPLSKKIQPLVKDLIDHRKQNYSDYELMVKGRLFEILHLIFDGNIVKDSSNVPGRQNKNNSERIKKIVSYTREHFSERITIGMAASVCSLSESRFMNFFREQTGMSYIRYLNDFRLESGAEELLSEKKPVTEIALDNGFENISYFIRAFKKKFGVTPLEYRSSNPHDRR